MPYLQAATGGHIGGPLISERWDDAAAGVKYAWVKPSVANAKGQVGVAGAITDYPVGILQNTPAQGEAASVQIGGISYANAGGTIAVGDRLAITAAGAVVADNTRKAGAAAATAPDYVVGIALSAASSGKLVKMLIRPYEVIET